MAQYIFKGNYKSNHGEVLVKLLLIHFVDENGIHIIYSPHLDLSGYGENEQKAKESFEIVFSEFIDYTLKKKTLGKVLKQLGWEIKGTQKKPKKLTAPSISTVIGENDYVSEIFDNM